MKFVIFKDIGGYWRWKLVSRNNKTIAVSSRMSSKPVAQHAAEVFPERIKELL